MYIYKSFNQIGSDLGGLSADDLIGVLDDQIRSPEQLKRDASRVFHPGAEPSPGPVWLGGADDEPPMFVFPESITQSIPHGYKPTHDDDPEEDLTGIEIVLRAVDLDYPDRGWWVLAPEVSDKRLPLQLGEGVDPQTLPVGRYITADVTVVYKVERAGRKARRMILNRVERR